MPPVIESAVACLLGLLFIVVAACSLHLLVCVSCCPHAISGKKGISLEGYLGLPIAAAIPVLTRRAKVADCKDNAVSIESVLRQLVNPFQKASTLDSLVDTFGVMAEQTPSFRQRFTVTGPLPVVCSVLMLGAWNTHACLWLAVATLLLLCNRR